MYLFLTCNTIILSLFQYQSSYKRLSIRQALNEMEAAFACSTAFSKICSTCFRFSLPHQPRLRGATKHPFPATTTTKPSCPNPHRQCLVSDTDEDPAPEKCNRAGPAFRKFPERMQALDLVCDLLNRVSAGITNDEIQRITVPSAYIYCIYRIYTVSHFAVNHATAPKPTFFVSMQRRLVEKFDSVV